MASVVDTPCEDDVGRISIHRWKSKCQSANPVITGNATSGASQNESHFAAQRLGFRQGNTLEGRLIRFGEESSIP